MPLYSWWNFEVKNHIDICLVIDGQNSCDYFNKYTTNGDQLKTSKIESLQEHHELENVLLITIPGLTLTLDPNKFKATTLFGKRLQGKDSILSFWKDMQDFGIAKSTEKNSSYSQLSEPNPDEIFVYSKMSSSSNHSDITTHESDTSNMHDNSMETSGSGSTGLRSLEEIDDSCGERDALIKRIRKKLLYTMPIDIYKLKEPPIEYRVRETNTEFIKDLATVFMEKRHICMENASAFICVIPNASIENFDKMNIGSYDIYVLDGNHSLQAQKIAYEQTNDPILSYRNCCLYGSLTIEEAIFLGVSRNEDNSKYARFTDFQKVDLLRKQLYQVTNTTRDLEPPEAPPEFTQRMKCLLNLKSKAEIDAKYILRFLSTKLSNRCFQLYRTICSRNINMPASKFKSLKGLSISDMEDVLSTLSESGLQKKDWTVFNQSCLRKKEIYVVCLIKTKKTKNVEVKFPEAEGDNVSNVYIDGKSTVHTMCFKFTWGTSSKVLSFSELRKHIFGKSMFMPSELSIADRTPVKGKILVEETDTDDEVFIENCPAYRSKRRILNTYYPQKKRNVYSFCGSDTTPVKGSNAIHNASPTMSTRSTPGPDEIISNISNYSTPKQKVYSGNRVVSLESQRKSFTSYGTNQATIQQKRPTHNHTPVGRNVEDSSCGSPSSPELFRYSPSKYSTPKRRVFKRKQNVVAKEKGYDVFVISANPLIKAYFLCKEVIPDKLLAHKYQSPKLLSMLKNCTDGTTILQKRNTDLQLGLAGVDKEKIDKIEQILPDSDIPSISKKKIRMLQRNRKSTNVTRKIATSVMAAKPDNATDKSSDLKKRCCVRLTDISTVNDLKIYVQNKQH